MKNKLFDFLILLSIFFNCCGSAYTQSAKPNQVKQNHSSSGWTTNNPFHTDVFVENKGQFNNWIESKLPVLYAVNNSDKIFFTKQGLIFRLQKMDTISEEEREHQEKDKDKEVEEDKGQKLFYVNMNWEGCNQNAELITIEQSEGYYTFGEKGYENVQAKGYKRLLYKDIYPNIDIEYTIPDKGGIKYKIILHPGADASLIKMHYSGDVDTLKIDKVGNVIIETETGDITDHAPESYYEAIKSKINSSFKINKNTVSFHLPNSISTLQTLIIDPWTTTPTGMTTNNAALDIDSDLKGNVYISGGITPFKLTKYSNLGAFLWTYTNPSNWSYSNGNYYSKFCVLTTTGTSFIGEGFTGPNPGSRVMKISTTGSLTTTSPYFGINNEIWRMFYNNCSKQIIAFGGGTQNNHNMKVIADTNLNSSISKIFNGATCNGYNDITSAVMDNNGDFYALMTNYGACTQVEGQLQKSLYSNNYTPPLAFDVQTNYQFQEGYPNLQGVSGNIVTVRANALALNKNYVFSYDGKTLKAWNKTNGSLKGTIVVDNTYIGGNYRIHEGIDVDDCNNVYVGGSSRVHVYHFTDSTFNQLSSIITNISGEVHDIKLNRVAGKLYVCGVGFVTEVLAPVACYLPSLNTVVVKDSCSGQACVSVSGGMPPYSFIWSNGSTDSCISGVPNGVYTVSIFDNSCALNSNLDSVSIYSFLQLDITPHNPTICPGDSITLHASSIVPGVTFHWSTGAVDSNIRVAPSSDSAYSVYATSNLCNDSIKTTVKIKQINFTTDPKLCQGNSYHVGTHTYTTTGIYNDTLSTSMGCDSIITTHLSIDSVSHKTINVALCQGQFYQIGNNFYSTPGTYIDTLASVSGCDSIITYILTYSPSPVINLGPDTTLCNGQTYTLNATYPGATYLWQNGATTPTIFINSISGSYWVTVTGPNGCSTYTTVNVTFGPQNKFSTDTMLCPGKTITLNVFSPGETYLWQNGSTSSTFVINTQGTYYVTTTLDSSCYRTDTIHVHNTTNPVVNFGNDTTFCLGKILHLQVSIPNASYLWQDGSISSYFNVSHQGTYWVEVTDINNCSARDSINVSIFSAFNINLGHDTLLCSGQNITLNASHPNSTYLWQDGATTTPSFNVTFPGTFYVSVTDNTGCKAYDTVLVSFINPPSVNLGNDTTLCNGQTLLYNVSSPNCTYLWQNGSTNPNFTITSAGTYWVRLTVNQICSTIDTIKVMYVSPPTVNLGPDTNLCWSQPYVLNATYPNSHYLWQNSSIQPTFTVTQAGTYWVKVYINNSCFASDTVHVTYNKIVNLGNDTSLCYGKSVTLKATYPNATYLWQNGSTNPTFTVSPPYTPYLFWVKVTVNNCSETDTILINYYNLPVISLGNDTTLCSGKQIQLNAYNTNSTYLWQDGSINPTYTVNQQGTYWVKVIDFNNCYTSDTIKITYVAVPIVNLGNDTTLCQGQILILNATNPNSYYLWQDNTTNAKYTVTQQGMYWVIVTNQNNCKTYDAINVYYVPNPVVSLGNITKFCIGDNLTLDAFTFNATYLWQDGSTSPQYTISQPGIYWVKVTDISSNCSTTSSIKLICDLEPIIPNIITPNNDGFNDYFVIKNYEYWDLDVQIFNRWGTIVYQDNNYLNNWKGTFNGYQLADGTYYYIIKAINKFDGIKKDYHSSLTILR